MDSKLILLVVEDEPSIAEMLVRYGEYSGYAVYQTDDGSEAVRLADELRPDVVLLDISLRGLDGRDVMKRLRQGRLAEGAVVVFLTARNQQSDRLLGLELGADDYETKPVRVAMLFRRLERLLAKKRGV